MKKGFTLAELLGVIVIISLLLLLIIPLITTGLKNKQEEIKQTTDNIIFESASEYLDKDKEKYPNKPGNIYCITLKELIDSGILDESVKDTYQDNHTIEITIDKNGVRKYQTTENKQCNTQTTKEINIIISPSNNKWSTSKKATIYYPDLNETYTKQYKINDETWQTTQDNQLEINYDKNGKIEARILGKTQIEAKSNIEKIDTTNPVIKKVSLSSWNDNYQQKIDITLTDAHSGVGGYCIKTDKTKPQANDKCFEEIRLPAYGGTKTISVYKKQGTYYIFAKDRVGNISEYNSSASFTVKDTTPPTCTLTISGTKGNNDWYTSNVTVQLKVNDDSSGVRTYGLTESATETFNKTNKITQTADTTNYSATNGYRTLYAYVEDKAGNKATPCKIQFRKDATPPTISYAMKMADGSNYTSGSLSDQNVTRTLSYSDNLSKISAVQMKSGNNWVTATGVPTYTYTNDGTYSTQYRVVDNAGNTSTTVSPVIKIQKDPDKNFTPNNTSCQHCECKETGSIECGLTDTSIHQYGYGGRWRFTWSGNKSNLDTNNTYVDYSTLYVDHYKTWYKSESKSGGAAEFTDNYMLFIRAYSARTICFKVTLDSKYAHSASCCTISSDPCYNE